MQIAPTVFKTGVEDSIGVVDVYTETSAITPIDDVTVDDVVDPNSLSSLMGGNLSANAPIVTGITSDGIKVDANALKTGVISSLGLSSTLSSLAAGIKEGITEVKGYTNILAQAGSIVNTIKSANLTSITGVANMLSTISSKAGSLGVNINGTIITDLSGSSNLSSTILNQAIKLGIPNSFSQFANGFKNNPNLLLNITNKILPNVINNSDINTLSNISTSVIGKSVMAANPNLINNFASNYKLPSNTPSNQLPLIGAQIGNTFNNLNPNWNKSIKSNGTVIGNSNVLQNASNDLQKVLGAVNAATNVVSRTLPVINFFQSAAQALSKQVIDPSTNEVTISTGIGKDSNGNQTTYPNTQTVVNPDGTTVVTGTSGDLKSNINITTDAEGNRTTTVTYPIQPVPSTPINIDDNEDVINSNTANNGDVINSNTAYNPPYMQYTNITAVPGNSGAIGTMADTLPGNFYTDSGTSSDGTIIKNSTIGNGSNYSNITNTDGSVAVVSLNTPTADETNQSVIDDANNINGDPLNPPNDNQFNASDMVVNDPDNLAFSNNQPTWNVA